MDFTLDTNPSNDQLDRQIVVPSASPSKFYGYNIFIPENLINRQYRPSTPPAGTTAHVTTIIPKIGTPFNGTLLLTGILGISDMSAKNELDDAIVISFYDDPAIIINCKHRIKWLLSDDSGEGTIAMKKVIDAHTREVIDLLKDGEKVVIHCKAGISRSVAFVCALLMLHAKDCGFECPFESANYHIADLRIDPENPRRHLSMTSINLGFASILYMYQQELFSK